MARGERKVETRYAHKRGGGEGGGGEGGVRRERVMTLWAYPETLHPDIGEMFSLVRTQMRSDRPFLHISRFFSYLDLVFGSSFLFAASFSLDLRLLLRPFISFASGR